MERSIEIVSLMNLENPSLVISHSEDDEGGLYSLRIREYARNLGVRFISVGDLVGPEGNNNHNGKKYTIGDMYQCSDLICYPSGYEGFGNAFLEAIYYKKPIVVNRYSIYVADIEPKGFDTIAIEGFVTGQTVEKIYRVLKDEERLRQMVETNYRLGEKFFSYEVLERLLLHLVNILEIQCAV